MALHVSELWQELCIGRALAGYSRGGIVLDASSFSLACPTHCDVDPWQVISTRWHCAVLRCMVGTVRCTSFYVCLYPWLASVASCWQEVTVYKATLPYNRHVPDMAWMRVPILLLGLAVVAITQGVAP